MLSDLCLPVNLTTDGLLFARLSVNDVGRPTYVRTSTVEAGSGTVPLYGVRSVDHWYGPAEAPFVKAPLIVKFARMTWAWNGVVAGGVRQISCVTYGPATLMKSGTWIAAP